jgi:hypothetical protein
MIFRRLTIIVAYGCEVSGVEPIASFDPVPWIWYIPGSDPPRLDLLSFVVHVCWNEALFVKGIPHFQRSIITVAINL